MEKKDIHGFEFLKKNRRERKPRRHGITEIRGPYYSAFDKRHLQDLFETMGEYIDSLKFAAGSFSLMPRKALTEIIELCHRHDVIVSTGGFIEYVLTQGADAVRSYIRVRRWASTSSKSPADSSPSPLMTG